MAEPNIKLYMEPEVVSDFRDSYGEQYEIIANCIMYLDQSPADTDLVDEVFRALHIVKGNASMCQMDAVAGLVHAVEDLVDFIRNDQLAYDQHVGESILLAMDRSKELAEAIFLDQAYDKPILSRLVDRIRDRNAWQQRSEYAAKQIIHLISGHIVEADSPLLDAQPTELPTSDPVAHKPLFAISPKSSTKQTDGALDTFLRLNQLLEQKLAYWQDRVQRSLPLAVALNKSLGEPVQQAQLEASVYMHDAAYAFLADDLILKDGKFTDDEQAQLRQHPQLSAELVALHPDWSVAATIIRQHHERWDGAGYPNGLQGEQICIGAQILAVVDAYEAMTHPRPGRQYKRSLLRAVTEINHCSGTQFSPQVTEIFNTCLRELLTERK